MSEQKKDLPNRFVEQLLGHGGSYTDVFFHWDRVGTIYDGNNDDITSSSTSITPCQIEGVCNCM